MFNEKSWKIEKKIWLDSLLKEGFTYSQALGYIDAKCDIFRGNCEKQMFDIMANDDYSWGYRRGYTK